MLEVCSGVTNKKEKDGGIRGPVGLWLEGPRVTGAPLCAVFELVLEVRTWWFYCCLLVNLINLNELSFERENIPFYR